MRPTYQLISSSFVAVILLTASGCGSSFEHRTPSGFVELEDQEDLGYDYRATSADGTVLAVRAMDNEPRGELGFWADAIRNRMRRQAGYAHLETRDVKTRSGLAGKQLRFGHDRSQKPHLYYITVFVTADRLFVLEAGGTAEQMQERAGDIEAAISGFTAR